jgi:hypothetical protein
MSTAIRLERDQWRDFMVNCRAVERGEAVPVRWPTAFDRVLRELGFAGFRQLTSDAVFSQDYQMNWLPFPAMVSWAVFCPSRVIYLCWGGIRGVAGLRRSRQRVLLGRAGRLLVNDDVTAQEIQSFVGRTDARIVPYYVDPKFFAFAPARNREDFWFCNSVNDRDPEVLLALAEAGHRIVWTVDAETLKGRYLGAHPNLLLRPRVLWPELARLYQTCRGFLMPTRNDFHAAGQTTVMEAIACGAPVVMSEGRTASIFRGVPSVRIVEDNSAERWRSELSACALAGPSAFDALQAESCLLTQRMSIPALAETFAPHLPKP